MPNAQGENTTARSVLGYVCQMSHRGEASVKLEQWSHRHCTKVTKSTIPLILNGVFEVPRRWTSIKGTQNHGSKKHLQIISSIHKQLTARLPPIIKTQATNRYLIMAYHAPADLTIHQKAKMADFENRLQRRLTQINKHHIYQRRLICSNDDNRADKCTCPRRDCKKKCRMANHGHEAEES